MTDSDDVMRSTDEPVAEESDAVEPDAVESDAVEPETVEPETVEEEPAPAGVDWSRVLAYGLLPALALALAMGAGFFKYVDNSVRAGGDARKESVQVATASTIALLSYSSDKVDQQLNGARGLLTGEFLDSYTSLINQVVIPGAKQQQISSVATVPRAGSVSADPSHAVVLVFVNQTVTVGASPPSASASSVNVTLDKVGDKWLISKFDPV